MASKEMERVNTMLGVEHPFRIGDSIIDLYPVKLRDWEKFSETLAALELETLYQVYSYKDAIDKFIECIKIVGRRADVPDCLYDIDDKQYEELRRIIIEQNNLDFDFLKRKQQELAKSIVGHSDSKNNPALGSQFPRG